MRIFVRHSQRDLKISSRSVKQAVHSLVELYSTSCDEIAIHFVSQKRISNLHHDFFNDPTPTDCISFPLDPSGDPSGYVFLGEIFICPQAAIDYVAKEKGNVYEEVTLYLVHGFLHLLGYDDMQAAQKNKMRREEKRAMNFLRTSNAIISA